jgi:cysteine sulfinate desulfinase/cysteine desulfurase-like protein
MNRVYLDYNASTPIAPEVAEAMWPFLSEGRCACQRAG